LLEVAARHGITELAFESSGRLRGRIDARHDLFDMFEFQQDASDLLGAEVALFSELSARAEQRPREPGPARSLCAVSEEHQRDRHALLELDALLAEIRSLHDEGDAVCFAADARYCWILHRLWIAAGNEDSDLLEYVGDHR